MRVAEFLGSYITDKRGLRAGLDVVEDFEFPEEKYKTLERMILSNMLDLLVPETPEFETYQRIREELKPDHRQVVDALLAHQTIRNQ